MVLAPPELGSPRGASRPTPVSTLAPLDPAQRQAISRRLAHDPELDVRRAAHRSLSDLKDKPGLLDALLAETEPEEAIEIARRLERLSSP